jgi:hypothetical protein
MLLVVQVLRMSFLPWWEEQLRARMERREAELQEPLEPLPVLD